MILIVFNFNSITNSKGWIMSVPCIFFAVYFKLIRIRERMTNGVIRHIILCINNYCFDDLWIITKKMICERIHCYFIDEIAYYSNR